MKLLHKLAHKFKWYYGSVVTRTDKDGFVRVGFKCDYCGLISNIHKVDVDKLILDVNKTQ